MHFIPVFLGKWPEFVAFICDVVRLRARGPREMSVTNQENSVWFQLQEDVYRNCKATNNSTLVVDHLLLDPSQL